MYVHTSSSGSSSCNSCKHSQQGVTFYELMSIREQFITVYIYVIYVLYNICKVLLCNVFLYDTWGK